MIKSMSIRDFRRKMSDAINRVAYGGDHVALTRHGEIVAVLVSYADLKELRKYQAKRGKVDPEIESIADHVVEKNEKLYRQLAE